MFLDAHHHLWRYDPGEYDWISDQMRGIARDFSVADLMNSATDLGVTGSVVVQARQTVEETNWLLGVAEDSPFIRGVVGWAPLVEDGVERCFDDWADGDKLRGFRHIVQDEPDDAFLDREDFNRGVAKLIARGYAYDILIYSRQFPAAVRFVDRHRNGRFILDHLGKPAVKNGEYETWRNGMVELARRETVWCKLSGLVTEADWNSWTREAMTPYLDAALEAFGPARLMFGSDWPVCLLAAEYQEWLDVLRHWASSLSRDEQHALFVGNAANFYGIEASP